jgi:hypothetical protein
MSFISRIKSHLHEVIRRSEVFLKYWFVFFVHQKQGRLFRSPVPQNRNLEGGYKTNFILTITIVECKGKKDELAQKRGLG